jgi:hypothetical protein
MIGKLNSRFSGVDIMPRNKSVTDQMLYAVQAHLAECVNLLNEARKTAGKGRRSKIQTLSKMLGFLVWTVEEIRGDNHHV